MTEIEKPLHVRVAEALGWYGLHLGPNGQWWGCFGRAPLPPGATGHQINGGPYVEGGWPLTVGAPPRYDTDWSATGPLIERFTICLSVRGDSDIGQVWEAGDNVPEYAEHQVSDAKLLTAVCRLLLMLYAAGKLKVAA